MVNGNKINDIKCCNCGNTHSGESLKKNIDIFSELFIPIECGCGQIIEIRYELEMNEIIRYKYKNVN